MKVEYKLSPSKEFPWFTTDPMADTRYYKSEDDMLYDQRSIIGEYCDDGWSEEVEQIKSGKITHVCSQCDKKERPSESELDEDGYDVDGIKWGRGFDFYCDYKLVEIDDLSKGAELTRSQLENMLRDPRYADPDKRDCRFVKRVSEGFKKLCKKGGE